MSVSTTSNFEVGRSFVTGGSLGNTVLDYNPCVTPEGCNGHRWIYPFAQSGSCSKRWEPSGYGPVEEGQ